MGTVTVDGYRNLIEPPELGDCQDPDCRTMANVLGDEVLITTQDELLRYIGKDLLLVAMYAPGDRSRWTRVCAPCDERRLRAMLT